MCVKSCCDEKMFPDLWFCNIFLLCSIFCLGSSNNIITEHGNKEEFKYVHHSSSPIHMSGEIEIYGRKLNNHEIPKPEKPSVIKKILINEEVLKRKRRDLFLSEKSYPFVKIFDSNLVYFNGRNFSERSAPISKVQSNSSSDINFVNKNRILERIHDLFYPNLWNYPEIGPNCSRLLKRFGNFAENFTLCAIKNSQPVSICQKCVSNYFNILDVYTQILKESDEKCQDMLLNTRRLSVVQVIYNNINNIWSQCNCINCISRDYENGTEVYSLSDDAKTFFSLLDKVKECFNSTELEVFKSTNSTNNTCEDCKEPYKNLNSFYEQLVTKYADTLCLDIADSMNLPRFLWRQEFCCMNLKFTGHYVFAVSALVALLIPVFYTAAKALTKTDDIKLVLPKRKSFVHNSYSIQK